MIVCFKSKNARYKDAMLLKVPTFTNLNAPANFVIPKSVLDSQNWTK